MPKSDRAAAKAYLGLRCPHMLEQVLAWHGPFGTYSTIFVCVEVLRPSQINGVMSSSVS